MIETPGQILESDGQIGPLAALRPVVPFDATAASDGLGWAGLQAARYRLSPASEINPPPLTHHWLVLFVRPLSSPRPPGRQRDGALSRGRLRAVIEYVEEHLGAGLTLEQMAAVARLSPYHFARQFKAATGLPPHQFVIARRVERARQFLQ